MFDVDRRRSSVPGGFDVDRVLEVLGVVESVQVSIVERRLQIC